MPYLEGSANRTDTTRVISHLTDSHDDTAIDLVPVSKSTAKEWLAEQPQAVRHWADATAFLGEPGAVCPVADATGRLDRVLVGLNDARDPWAFAAVPGKLPPGLYRYGDDLDARAATAAALGWALASYAFTRYKSRNGRTSPRLAWPAGCDRAAVERVVAGTQIVRDLVNTPASDMGPHELAEAAMRIADDHAARRRVIVGDALLDEGFPAIHAVGRASVRAPRLIDLRWGDEMAPRVTIVGKGVCFDSGGLDLKPSSNMKLMKKDMGGAAHALGLAKMVMMAGLRLRLRVLIPAVENSVSGAAMRPLDVLATRKGLTVEVGNTDAEGRLILADALAEADRERPDLLIDLATLTGAARTALGPDIPALFSNSDALAHDLLRHGDDQADPLWRLPLWKPYRRMLDSKVADLTNASDSPHAGAVTAALFLQEFVAPATAWAHLDIFAWNAGTRPGRPEGGDAQGLRAIFAMLAERYPE